MAYRYSTATQHTGASIGTVISVPKPGNWSSSNNPTTEGNNWSVQPRFPGWIECDGRTLEKSDYIALYQVIGDTYGSTSTTFNLPDYRSRMLMGTGTVDGQQPGGISLGPDAGPGNSSVTAAPNIAGSTGGTYVMTTVRQLPPLSEITPGGQTGEAVYYSVTENFLTSKASYSGTALVNYGDGEFADKNSTTTSPECSGFRNGGADVTNNIENATQYVGFGTSGTSPFGSLQLNRQVAYSNLDFSDATTFFVYVIVGNDENGGERPNDPGEGIYLRWPNGTESLLVPSRQQFLAAGSGDEDDYDNAYSNWREIFIDIPTQYRTSNVTITLRQTVDPTITSEMGATLTASNPNAFDMIGIQYLGWRGSNIGGNATDTFSISTFTSDGFDQVTTVVEPYIYGNVSWSAGPVGEFATPSVAPHYHEIRYAQRGSTSAAEGSPYAGAKDVGFMGESEASVLTYDRFGASLLKHSHYLSWGYSTEYAAYGNDESYGSSGLVNIQDPGGSITQKFGTSFAEDDNRGAIINKTIDVVNQGGVFCNIGQFELSTAAKSVFDSALSVRLQAAEEVELMQPYFRIKYIIKAW
ncbi:short tail fiber protein [Synechococcus phage ACG-2014h]|uniref:Short tail fiber protein n=1 Tax=Synechococcus phage ACG-2014h TaxID=1340810 RepID=V5US27_9CAUD|nr:short tail fiber protein [Synechococcus phage ACG-2014h]AHB80443.1 short tail fiber protein [Synechococcus phage ACG-2014h]